MANRIYEAGGGKAASPSQCRMSVLPSHGSPALQQVGATTPICTRPRVLARVVRRFSVLRALYGEDEVCRFRYAGEVRPAPERSAAFQSAQVAWNRRLISACLAILAILAILAKVPLCWGVRIFPVGWQKIPCSVAGILVEHGGQFGQRIARRGSRPGPLPDLSERDTSSISMMRIGKRRRRRFRRVICRAPTAPRSRPSSNSCQHPRRLR